VFLSVVSLLFTPLYVKYLTTTDYGHLGLLILFATLAKIVFRMGLDAGFFRVHYSLYTPVEQGRLAGTVAAAAALGGGVLLLAVVAARGPLTQALLGAEAPSSWWVVLVAGETFLGTFLFVPLSLLRIQDRPRLFSALSAGRHTLNILLKVAFVTAGYGVEGILWSDLIATGALALGLLPIMGRHLTPAFDLALLRPALAFGLPKVPHGMFVQILNGMDRKVLDLFISRAEVGLYHTGYTLGAGVKFATSAFEPAFGPFVYAQLKDPEAPRTFARVATYAYAGFLAVTLLVAVLGRELLHLLTYTNPAFREAAPVIPVVALAYLLHGVFLLGSIGIGISRRASYYPIVTAAAAATNITLNLALIPRHGMMGAAWATVASYAVMAGLGVAFSQRAYPIPFEASRLFRLSAAGLATHFVSTFAPAALWPAVGVKLASLFVFPLLLGLMGFFGPSERAFLRRLGGG
jgi:O-antigen/teichoic acid export membrane protein